ncbi:MAG: transposase [Acidobacteriota bacterium]|nr:transposase [Acidobacteriota bacterium]
MVETKFVSLDVHKDTVAIVVVNEQGDSLIQSVVATDAGIIRDFLLGLSGKTHITFEAGTQSNWLYRETNSIVEKVVVCNPRHNKLLMVGNKSDLTDAEKLAQLLRLDSLKAVWQHSSEQLQLKELVRTHENLVSDCIRVMNRIKAIYRSRGIRCSGSSVYSPAKRGQWIAKLSEPGSVFRAETLFAELETLTGLRKQAKKKMLRQAGRHQDYKRLCTVPGLAFISVSRLLAIVGDPFRFQTKRQFWKYCGFAVTTRSSADHLFVGGNLQKRIKLHNK